MSKAAKTFTISTSMALVATSAMASVGQEERIDVSSDYSLPEGMAENIEAALGKRNVRDAVNQAFFTLINGFGEDGQVLDERYFEGRYGEMMRNGVQVAQSDAQDSTINTFSGGACYSNCYGNCHSACHGACHGSRGWR